MLAPPSDRNEDSAERKVFTALAVLATTGLFGLACSDERWTRPNRIRRRDVHRR